MSGYRQRSSREVSSYEARGPSRMRDHQPDAGSPRHHRHGEAGSHTSGSRRGQNSAPRTESRSDPRPVFHYTDKKGALGILDSEMIRPSKESGGSDARYGSGVYGTKKDPGYSSREIALNNYGKDSPALRQKTDIAIAIHPTAKGESLFQDVSESGQRDVWIYPSDHALDINDHHNIQSITFYNRMRDFEVIAHQRNTPDGPVRTVSRSLKDLQTENSIAPIHNYDTDEDEDEDEHEDEEDKIEKDGEDDKDGEDQDDRHGGSGSVMVVFSGLMVPMSYDNNEGSDDSRENASEESYDTGAYHNGDYDDDDDDDDDHIQSYLNDINEENEDDDSEVGDCREDVDEDDWNDEEEKGDYNPYEGDEEDYYVFGEFYADDVEYEEEDIRTDEEDENNGSSDKEDDSGDGNDYSDYDGNDDDDD